MTSVVEISLGDWIL